MSLVRLIYASRFRSSKFETGELARIHESALKNNSELDITGVLLFGNDHFLQCLEGEREVVNSLYCKIIKDPRHESPTLLFFDSIIERSFDEWSMKMVMLTEKKLALVKKFSSNSTFNPFKMDPKSALHFLQAL